jgi:hypothetical protein
MIGQGSPSNMSIASTGFEDMSIKSKDIDTLDVSLAVTGLWGYVTKMAK